MKFLLYRMKEQMCEGGTSGLFVFDVYKIRCFLRFSFSFNAMTMVNLPIYMSLVDVSSFIHLMFHVVSDTWLSQDIAQNSTT